MKSAPGCWRRRGGQSKCCEGGRGDGFGKTGEHLRHGANVLSIGKLLKIV